LVINKLGATISAPNTSTVYNGQTQTQGSAVLSGFVAGDSITTTGTATGRNAGTYNSNLSATGADAGNYSINFTNNPLTIAKAPLSFVNTQVVDKVYDGQTAATVTPGTMTGLVAGETLSFSSVTGQFESATPGEAKPVTVVYGLSDGANGGMASNYTWSPVKASGRIVSESKTPITTTVTAPANGFSRVSYLGFTGQSGAALGTTGLADSGQCSASQIEECVCDQPDNQLVEVCVEPSRQSSNSMESNPIQWFNQLFNKK
jgi:hypothetical protein